MAKRNSEATSVCHESASTDVYLDVTAKAVKKVSRRSETGGNLE